MTRVEHAEMAAEQTVAPRPALAVDFVNTLEWRGSKSNDTLKRLSDLIKWLESSGALTHNASVVLERWFSRDPRGAATVFLEAIESRETLYRLLRAKALGAALIPSDLARLNRVLSEAGARDKLNRADGALGWRMSIKPTASSMLTAILWSGADLLASQAPTRLRECANDQCRWMFIDDSKGGTRRWCSMQSCGNRAKAQRHYQRSKQR